jgi:predicted oxidoreductase
MSFEHLKADVDLLMQKLVERPEDVVVLREQLAEKLAEMRALGIDMPPDLVEVEQAIDAQEAGDGPDFDNMPV